MQNDSGRVVIVGAGHGGVNAAAFLRQQGFAGEIVLIGEEPVAPYHRPPLSKTYITTDTGIDGICLKPAQFYRDQRIDLRLGCQVLEVRADDKAVRCADGTDLTYDFLILATGAVPRRLEVPGSELVGVRQLRTLADADQLREALKTGGRWIIVGGGYIGLEVAAACRTAGIEVTVMEREERLLSRVASAELSEFLTAYHREHGTEIVPSANIEGFAGDADGHVRRVLLGNGREIDCDAVVAGVGAIPCEELARSAGLRCDGGVLVDAQARTSDSSIFAIGDMTRRPLGSHPDLLRMESIPSAVEQAAQAATAILGQPDRQPEVPWFWSDQFDLKLKIAGVLHESDRVISRKTGDGTKAAFYHLRDDAAIAVETVNAAPEFMAGKRFIESGTRLDVDKLADGSVPLREAVVGK